MINCRFAFLFALLAGCACQRPATKPESTGNEPPSAGVAATPIAPLGPAISVGAGSAKTMAKPLTSSGDNSDARYSADGTRILFVSRARPSHKQAQVYELHLEKRTEKRITFHDGEDTAPFYLPDGKTFAFSSSTDEIKEEPYSVNRLMKTYYPEGLEKGGKNEFLEGTELYLQPLNGRSIERITRAAGLDTDGDAEPKGKVILFSSDRGGDFTHLYTYTLAAKRTTRVTEGKVIDRGGRYSPDGHFVTWSRQSGDAKNEEMQIMVAGSDFKKPKALTVGAGLNLQPSWNSAGDEIVFASNRDGKAFNLYTIDRAGTCLRRLTDGDFDQIQPSFSPDGKRVLFTAKQSGHNHIYVLDYVRPSECQKMAAVPAAIATPAPAAAAASPTPTATASPAPAAAPAASPSPAP